MSLTSGPTDIPLHAGDRRTAAFSSAAVAIPRLAHSSMSHERSLPSSGRANRSACRIAATKSRKDASPGGSQSSPLNTMLPTRFVARITDSRKPRSEEPRSQESPIADAVAWIALASTL
jgi:hypothetical protein